MERNAKLLAEQTHKAPAAEPVALTPAALAYLKPRTGVGQPRGYIDTKSNSPRIRAQRKLIEGLQNSPRMVAQRRQINGMFRDAAQRKEGPEGEELLQGKFEPIQRQGPEVEKLLQGEFVPMQRGEAGSDGEHRENKTGLPDNIKTGVESLSGMSLDNVKVHYNSAQPAQLNALAYAQGTDIHIAPGQEQHLPHEAWHIVQQAQGRVQPTVQMKDGVPVNDDAGLEREAKVMGAKALAPAAERRERPAAQCIAASNNAMVVNNLPKAAAQRALAETGNDIPRTNAQRSSIPAVSSSPQLVDQAGRLDGLFGAAQLRPDAASASYRPSHLLQLQRPQGNAAVSGMIAARRPSRGIIQRNEKSAKLLTELATPQVGEGPSVDVQIELVKGLEKLIEATTWKFTEPSELNIGGILIDRLPNAEQSYKASSENKETKKGEIHDLYERLTAKDEVKGTAANFVGLEQGKVTGMRSSGVAFGSRVQQGGLGAKVMENTLKTMLDAQQVEYLRLAGLPNDKWKILVELHYIRARPKDMAGFHKDTQGESLFVNLNYHVPGRLLRGPEYIKNPPRSEKHDERIMGKDEQPGTLPTEFTDDLMHTRKALGSPTHIDSAGTVEGTGYVAFVDEAIHHATPWFGGRYITPTEFKEHLRRVHKSKYDEIVRADLAYNSRSFFAYGYSLPSYVNKAIIPEDEIQKWQTWLTMAGVIETEKSKRQRAIKYTRDDFTTTMKPDEFELMLEEIGSQEGAERASAGVGGWHSASIPKDGKSPVRPKDRPPLIRTASNPNLTKDWPKQLPDEVPRRFIRSWVRAVPTSFADSIRES